MKKMFTLIAGLLLAAAVFAADRGPTLIINSQKNYKVVIDGRSYFGSDASIRISNLSQGMHSIRVFEMKRGLFDRGEKLVSSTSFKMGKKDVKISIDRAGHVTVLKTKGRKQINSRTYRMQKSPRF